VKPGVEQEDVALAEGTRLGQYTIVRLIAAGSMGMVYEAEHRAIGKRVALKVLSPRLAGAPNARVRFLHEAEVTARLQHPHIVDVTDRGDDGGHAYIVMELLRGEDLAQRLQRTGPIAAEEIVDIMLPICAAIGAAHKQGITHRDLKPSNVFLAEREGRVHPTVLDFGISTGNEAIAALDARTLSRAGAVVGTPYYLAPEQILDSRSASPASDQYALGVILYECLTGQRPFDGRDISAVFRTIRGGNARRPSALRPEIPLALEEAALRAMKQSPRSRFGSVMEFGRTLLPFASSRTRLLWEDAFAVTAGAPPATAAAVTTGAPPATAAAMTAGALPAAAAVTAGAPPATVGALPAAAAARRGASPAIAAEAATPSPYVRTLTPEVQAIDDPVTLPPAEAEPARAGLPGDSDAAWFDAEPVAGPDELSFPGVAAWNRTQRRRLAGSVAAAVAISLCVVVLLVKRGSSPGKVAEAPAVAAPAPAPVLADPKPAQTALAAQTPPAPPAELPPPPSAIAPPPAAIAPPPAAIAPAKAEVAAPPAEVAHPPAKAEVAAIPEEAPPAPAKKALADKAPADKAPAEKAPADRVLAEKAPADKAPAEKAATHASTARKPNPAAATDNGTVAKPRPADSGASRRRSRVPILY
jgi:serine/threonine-protein kinase